MREGVASASGFDIADPVEHLLLFRKAAIGFDSAQEIPMPKDGLQFCDRFGKGDVMLYLQSVLPVVLQRVRHARPPRGARHAGFGKARIHATAHHVRLDGRGRIRLRMLDLPLAAVNLHTRQVHATQAAKHGVEAIILPVVLLEQPRPNGFCFGGQPLLGFGLPLITIAVCCQPFARIGVEVPERELHGLKLRHGANRRVFLNLLEFPQAAQASHQPLARKHLLEHGGKIRFALLHVVRLCGGSFEQVAPCRFVKVRCGVVAKQVDEKPGCVQAGIHVIKRPPFEARCLVERLLACVRLVGIIGRADSLDAVATFLRPFFAELRQLLDVRQPAGLVGFACCIERRRDFRRVALAFGVRSIHDRPEGLKQRQAHFLPRLRLCIICHGTA